jgi:hypothetical protein
MRDGKKSPLHVGDATVVVIAIAAGFHGCGMWHVAAQSSSVMCIVYCIRW